MLYDVLPPVVTVALLGGLVTRAALRRHRYGRDARGELSEAQRAELARAETDRLSQPGNSWGVGGGM